MTDVQPAGIPSDTSIEVWKVQMEILRDLAPAQRHQTWFEFQCETDELAMNAIRRSFPDRSERFHLAEFVRRAHGAELAGAAYPDINLDR